MDIKVTFIKKGYYKIMLEMAIGSLDSHIRYCEVTGGKTVTFTIEEAKSILDLLKQQKEQLKKEKLKKIK